MRRKGETPVRGISAMNILILSRCLQTVGVFLGMLCTLCSLGCSNTKEVVVLQDRTAIIRDPLDIRFEKIDLHKVPITRALLLLSQSINSDPRGTSNFVWYGPRSATIEEALKVKEPQVSVHAENVDLRFILDRICEQAGWSYVYGVKGFEFSEGRSPTAARFEIVPPLRRAGRESGSKKMLGK